MKVQPSSSRFFTLKCGECFLTHLRSTFCCLWKCSLAAGAQNPTLSYTSVASAAVVKFRACKTSALTYSWLLRVKEPKRSWWPESSCHAARWTWRRSALSTRPTSGSRCKRPSRWMRQRQRFIKRFVLSRSLANLLCLGRNTLRETTRRCCSACVEQRNKWNRSSVSEGPHFPPLESCTRKVGFWKIILAPNCGKSPSSFFCTTRLSATFSEISLSFWHVKNLCSGSRWFYRHSNKVALFKFCFFSVHPTFFLTWCSLSQPLEGAIVTLKATAGSSPESQGPIISDVCC